MGLPALSGISSGMARDGGQECLYAVQKGKNQRNDAA